MSKHTLQRTNEIACVHCFQYSAQDMIGTVCLLFYDLTGQRCICWCYNWGELIKIMLRYNASSFKNMAQLLLHQDGAYFAADFHFLKPV